MDAFADEWRLVKDEDGIQVYLRERSDSQIQEYKGISIMQTSADSILAVFNDIDVCPIWFHQCENPLMIHRVSFLEHYGYQVSNFPFPASDRDLIANVRFDEDPNTKIFTIRLQAAPDYCDQRQTEVCKKVRAMNKIRITRSDGKCSIEPQQEGFVKVTWQHHVEPAGMLPDWLINALLVDIPYYTMQGLRNLVKQDPYRRAKLRYGPDGVAVGFKQ